jgi:enediyne biosynthesis protein CalE5
MQATMDPRQVKAQQRKAWDHSAAGWKKWWPVFEACAQPVSDALLDLAAVQEGHWVLDVATGTGEPALSAARRVGKTGKVVGIDQSPRMLAIAQERARAGGFDNVGFQELDAESLGSWPEASYDAAVCRFGLMLMPNVGEALRGIHHVLTRGAALAAAVWAAPERVPAIALARRVISESLALPPPPPGSVSPFSLSEPGKLEQAMSSAGWKGVRAERAAIVWSWESPAAYAEFVKDTSALAVLVHEQPPEKQAEVWKALAEAAAPHAVEGGRVEMVCDVTCVTGKKG